MAFNVSTLPAYVQDNKDLLLKNFALVGGTRSRISIQTGVKHSAHLNFMEVAPTLQDGAGCAFTNAGEVSLTQRTIETAAIKINLDLCPKTLRGKYAEYLIQVNASEQELPFEAYIMEGVTNVLAKKIETLMWQGDKSKSADANLKWVDGFLKIAEGESEVKDVTITTDSIYGAIAKVYAELPDEAIERGAEIYVSPANYRKFMMEMVEKNFFHYAGAVEAAPTEFYFPGTSAKVVMTAGLTGVNDKIVGTFAKNLFYGCDMENDEEVIEIWWSQDDRNFKLAAEWNSGVQIAFPNMVVVGATA
jgi:hypothetical protein